MDTLEAEQLERLDFLVKFLLEERNESLDLEKMSVSNKKTMFRNLMNTRKPKKNLKEFLKVQDQYLKKEALKKGIIKAIDIPTVKEQFNSSFKYADKVCIWQGDITRLKIGAIVNAANSSLLGCFIPSHGCIDNAIHSAAGVQLRYMCNQYMECKNAEYRKHNKGDYKEPVGSAVLTKGYNLPSRYIIHTVGPKTNFNIKSEFIKQKKECYIFDQNVSYTDIEKLKQCYESCLITAMKNGIRTIAFCCISTGEFAFPSKDAAETAVEAIEEFLDKNNDKIDKIVFNVYKDKDYISYRDILK